MVHPLSIVFMAISDILAVGVPIAVLIYFYRRFSLNWKPILVGALIFFIFSQILEKLLHVYVLRVNPETMAFMKNHYAYAVYGGLAAGVFEEVGRYFGFRYLLEKYREWKDGIAYGIGHGGLEALLVGGLSFIQSIVFSVMINSSQFGQLIASSGGGETAAALLKVKNQLVGTPSYEFLLGGFERVFAFALQLALSVLVLYAVKNRKSIYLLYAILIHAAVDFLAVMSGYWKLNAFVTEGFLCVIAILSVVYLTVTYKRKKQQTNPISE